MINFFRKIRRKLTEDNKPLKYMRYAIGEIVLVVIGILIALQINNWNENRQIQNQVNLQLKNLKTAIQSDIESHDRVLGMEGFRFHAIKYILEMAGETVRLYDYHYDEFPNQPRILWKKPIPKGWDRAYFDACFSAIDLGTVGSFINDKAIIEFGNSGLYSALNNPQLKSIINEYYLNAEMWFSGILWDNNLEITMKTKDLLENQYLIDLRRMSDIEDPIRLIRENKLIIIRLNTLLDKVSLTCETLVNSRKRAEQVMLAIDQELKE